MKPFLAENCYGCHGHRRNRTDLNLEAFETLQALQEDPGTWEKVLSKLQTGAMPPEDEPRPDPRALESVMGWIGAELRRVELNTRPDPGRVTARRLNRTEYDNTVRDLLGVELGLAVDFPQDDAGYGFDNIGDVLSLSPVLMERYVAAADEIARVAIFGQRDIEPTMVRLRARSGHIESTTEPLFEYDQTGMSLPNGLHAEHRFPADGEYTFRFVLGGSHPTGADPLNFGLWVDGVRVGGAQVDPEPDQYSINSFDLYGFVAEMRARVPAGSHWVAATVERLYEGLPARLGGPNPTQRRAEAPVFKPPTGASPRGFERFRKRFEMFKSLPPPVNLARIIRVEVRGPFEVAQGPSPQAVAKVFTCGHTTGQHVPACASVIVGNLARRAFRRPVAEEEVSGYVSLVTLATSLGDSFETGISVALRALLVAPDFLFRVEREPEQPTSAEGYEIGMYELASRLSYFLWASMPDDELLDLAGQGRLRDAEVLARQVARMLRDPRARSLSESFGAQWLQYRGLAAAAPDRDRYPDFEDNLRLSMRRETELFFQSIVAQDRSILDLIAGSYSFLNERLARHYGISGVVGPEFREVSLAGTPRAGVLTHGSVLTVTSYATRTSPVLRGKWVLDNILNAPPPPPPPDVPNLDEAKVGTSASLREQLEVHRENAICSSCHSQMDPLGFGLENFDGVGAWRSADGEHAVDASGTLPDGRSFRGPEGLTRILKQEKDAFAASLADKLLTYALGRGLERYDRVTVKQIACRVADADYRFGALALAIVESKPFQMRRAEEPK